MPRSHNASVAGSPGTQCFGGACPFQAFRLQEWEITTEAKETSEPGFEVTGRGLQSTLALWTPRCYGHPANTDRSQIPVNFFFFYRRLTEIFSRHYGLSLLRALTRGLESVHNDGS